MRHTPLSALAALLLVSAPLHAQANPRFTAYPGLFLYHCHILEHEDAGMMRNFQVST